MPPSIQDWNIDAEQIKDRFYCDDIYLYRFPKIAFMVIRQHGLETKTQRYSPTSTKLSTMVRNDKFVLKSYGEWQLEIGQVAMSKFSNREQFDLIVDGMTNKIKDKLSNAPTIDTISMLQALAKMCVSLRENDSNQEDIFNEEIIYLLGGECSDDETTETGSKKCMLRDFRMVTSQEEKATAQRGNFYVYLDYYSS